MEGIAWKGQSIDWANVHDVQLLTVTFDKMVCKRPRPLRGQPQRRCADAGYKGDPATKAVLASLYRPHIKQRKEEGDAKRQRASKRRKPALMRY
jgi:hypothetical protein